MSFPRKKWKLEQSNCTFVNKMIRISHTHVIFQEEKNKSIQNDNILYL
jgi:hypothetical protein